MKTAISRLFVVFAFLFGAILVSTSALSDPYDPPANGKLGDCYNGKDYGVPALCTGNAEACGGSGHCVLMENLYVCPNGSCPGGGCSYFRKIETDTVGYCSYMPEGSESCTRCDWFCCARGGFYGTAANCEDEAMKRCDGILWVAGTCNAP